MVCKPAQRCMAREVIVPKVQPTTVLLNGQLVKLPSRYLNSTHRSLLLSTLSREASLYSVQQVMQRLITVQSVDTVTVECSALNACPIQPPHPRLRDPHRTGGIMTAEARGWGGML